MVIQLKEGKKKRKRSISENALKKEEINPLTPSPLKGLSVKEIKNETPSTPAAATPQIKNETPSTPAATTAQTYLDSSKVKSAIKAVFKLIEDFASKKASLFGDEAVPIHLQITSVKVPRTPERQIRFQVPHTLLKDTSDVCLFVADLKKGKKEDHEPTLAHYRDLLERNGVTGITQIIPVRQLKVEYDQYEMKRRLCDQFDCFLSEAKVSGHVRHLLGKEFIKKRKYPTPLKLNAKDLKKEFARAMSKTVLNLHGRGNCSVMTVGHSKMTPQQITENILTVAAGLAREYPGGWDNIRSLNIKTPKSLPIPIYLTLKSSNTLDVPRVTPKRPKAAKPVEDELSTFPGARVKVLPSGKVIVTKDENEEEDSDTELKEILEEFSSSKSKKKKGNNMKVRKRQEKTTPSRTNVRTLSANTTMEDSINNEVDDDDGDDDDDDDDEDGGIEEDSEDEMDIMSVSQVSKEKKSPGTRATEVQSKQKKKKKKKAQVVLNEEKEEDDDDDDDDDDEIEDVESAYLSQMFQQQESSNTLKDAKKLPSGDLQDKKKKRRKRKNKKKVLEAGDEIERKKQKSLKVATESKPTNFVKIKKKNHLNAALRRIKNKK